MSSRLLANSSRPSEWLRAHLAELAIFALAVSLLFVKLGIGEFEDWDESHIVYRAHVVEAHGAWLDQSGYSLGGLYSAAHPPLGVWLMVVSRGIFGKNEFATRLPAALCGMAAAISMFFLLRRRCSDRMALLFAAAFISCSVMLWFSRHAQLDSLLIATSLISLTVSLQAMDKRSRGLTLLSGVCFGIALFSKFGWAFYALPFIIGYWYLHSKDKVLLAIFLVPAILLGGSWYLYMVLTNDAFVTSTLGWLTGLSSVAGYETSSKGPVYYFNQLVLACPYIIPALAIMFRDRRARQPDTWLALAWLGVVMVALQLAATKFPHFALMLLPPAFLVGAISLSGKAIKPVEWLLMTIAVLWSLSTQFRLWMRGVQFEFLPPRWEIAIPLGFGLIILLFLIRKDKQRVLINALTGLVVIVAANRVIAMPDDLYNSGAKTIATRLLSRSDVTELLVVHSGHPHDSLTPRLAYYTQGWSSGWLKGKGSHKLEWTDPSLLSHLLHLAGDSSGVVLERERDRFAENIVKSIPIYPEVVRALRQRYIHYDSLRAYDLFYN